jgi:transcriptional regulator with XRE-family HTH domain
MKKAAKTLKRMDAATDLWRRALPHLRRNMRLSQAELAALAGISQQSLSKFEDGSRALSAEAFARLEGALQKATRDRKADAENNWGMNSLGLLAPPLWPFETFSQSSPTETPEQKAEWEQIQKEADELVEVGNKAIQELRKPENAAIIFKPLTANISKPELLQKHNALVKSLADMTKRGYEMFRSADVEAKDRRIAELEEEIRTLKGVAEK